MASYRGLPPDLNSGGIARLYQELLQPLTLLPRPGAGSRGYPVGLSSAPATPEADSPAPLTREAEGSAPLSALPRLLEARMRRLPCPGLPAAVKSALQELVLEEVRALCREPRLWAPEPSLSPGEQQELRRRTVAHAALVAEGLLQHYLQLLRQAGPGGLLTPPAALARLRAQLMLHCAQLLHPHSVRVCLLRDMRELREAQASAGRDGTAPTRGSTGGSAKTLSGARPATNTGGAAGAPRISTGGDAQPVGHVSKSPGGVTGTGDAQVTSTRCALDRQPRKVRPFSPGEASMSEKKRALPSREIRCTNTGRASGHQAVPNHQIQQPRFGYPPIDHEAADYPQEFRPLTCKTFTSCLSALTMDYFVNLSRPHIERHRQQRVEDLREIQSIPPLDLSKVYHLLRCPQVRVDSSTGMPCQAVRTPCPVLCSKGPRSAQQTKAFRVADLNRCQSLPNLRMGELSTEELGIPMKRFLSQTSLLPPSGATADVEVSAEDDLRKLMEPSKEQTLPSAEDPSNDAELPPLIRALNHGKVNTSKLRDMQERIRVLSEKEEVKLREDTVLSEEQACPQSDAVYLHIPNKPTLKTADVQISNRIFLDVSDIKKYPPIYNELLGEIEPATVSRLDKSLSKGEDVRDVYSELKNSIPTDHLRFDQDPCIEPYAANVDLSKCMTSSTLTRRREERVINPQLTNLIQHDQFSSDRGTSGDHQENLSSQDHRRSHAQSSWIKQLKETLSLDDYLKYVSSQDTDYLGVVFHLYNSDDSEDEDQAAIEAATKQREERKKEKAKLLAQLWSKKEQRFPGMWNANSILLGGLGGICGFGAVEPEQEVEEASTTAELEVIQSRLEAVWKSLHVPESERLDMAIKYSSREYQALIPKAVDAWEKATEVILQREQLLKKLEMFEQTASDPNRFFQRGYEGSFVARKKEAKERKALHFQISKTEAELLKMLQKIKKTYKDTMTFKGRPYLEKMQWDKTEMLYWLQQERRKISMGIDPKNENLCAMLPPLHAPL
ncbi:coiled-coil domain-containing protein 87 [Pleurodeles waltl]|uniref:coiled-coil domain-containing protein 87 n=1 Tax=Pleurodeles waltl TaxID=8319 RepID=UPI0037097B0C